MKLVKYELVNNEVIFGQIATKRCYKRNISLI
jgi:hypothetical protein